LKGGAAARRRCRFVLCGSAADAGAIAKYHEALKCAPNWKQLKDAREALATHKS
jgi:hypothetical protein